MREERKGREDGSVRVGRREKGTTVIMLHTQIKWAGHRVVAHLSNGSGRQVKHFEPVASNRVEELHLKREREVERGE